MYNMYVTVAYCNVTTNTRSCLPYMLSKKMLERLQVQSPIAFETADGQHGGFNQEIEARGSY